MEAYGELSKLRFDNLLSGKTTTGEDAIAWLTNKPERQEFADYLMSDTRYFQILQHIDDIDDSGKFGREIKAIIIEKYGLSEEEIDSAFEAAYNFYQKKHHTGECILSSMQAVWRKIKRR